MNRPRPRAVPKHGVLCFVFACPGGQATGKGQDIGFWTTYVRAASAKDQGQHYGGSHERWACVRHECRYRRHWRGLRQCRVASRQLIDICLLSIAFHGGNGLAHLVLAERQMRVVMRLERGRTEACVAYNGDVGGFNSLTTNEHKKVESEVRVQVRVAESR